VGVGWDALRRDGEVLIHEPRRHLGLASVEKKADLMTTSATSFSRSAAPSE
jgi:hypothetical protein